VLRRDNILKIESFRFPNPAANTVIHSRQVRLSRRGLRVHMKILSR
jgi:hypothetical protein